MLDSSESSPFNVGFTIVSSTELEQCAVTVHLVLKRFLDTTLTANQTQKSSLF